MAMINLLTYTKSDTVLHNLNVTTKTLSLIVITTSLFSSSLLFLICWLFFALLLIFITKLSLLSIIANTRFLVYLILFSLIVGAIDTSFFPAITFNKTKLIAQSIFGLRMFSSFLFTELYLRTTRISSINDLITFCTRSIPLINKIDIGLYITLTIKYIPQTISEFNRINNAWDIKSGYKNKDLLYKSLTLFIPLIRNMIYKSISTANSMQIRKYNMQRSLLLENLRVVDYMILFILLISLLIKNDHIKTLFNMVIS